MENIVSIFQILPSKKLIKSSFLVFVLFATIYLLLLGTIFNTISKNKKLGAILERESQMFYVMQEADALKNKDFGLDSFLKLGYAESHKFEVVHSVKNVASIKASRY